MNELALTSKIEVLRQNYNVLEVI